jgi:hypothetical protein
MNRVPVDTAPGMTFVPEVRDYHPVPGADSSFVDFSGA